MGYSSSGPKELGTAEQLSIYVLCLITKIKPMAVCQVDRQATAHVYICVCIYIYIYTYIYIYPCVSDITRVIWIVWPFQLTCILYINLFHLLSSAQSYML